MSKDRQDKRNKIKPFIKVINYNHLMPTRYTLELEGLKGVVSTETFKEVSQREDAKKTVKKVFEERYTSGKNRWFFTPLSMFAPERISVLRYNGQGANICFYQGSKVFVLIKLGRGSWVGLLKQHPNGIKKPRFLRAQCKT